MRSAPARSGFTAWVEHLAREQTDALVVTALGEGLAGEDAVDAVHEALTSFLKLPQARNLAEHRDDAAAILAVLVRDAARTARQRPARPRSAEDEPAPPRAATPSAATLIAAAEQHLAILGSVSKLAEVQRAVVRLRAIEEMSSGEAARQLGLGPAALAALLQRAKEALKHSMAD
jgi:DNA-directed RNA polymerase specialized sigma24 family protein